MTRFDIPDRDGKLYLRRWRLIQTPWFGIYLHKILQPDHDREMHDHPWSFISIVLWGGYVEARPKIEQMRLRGIGSVAFRRAEDLHRIFELLRCPTWTLVLVGRRRREWGFQVNGGWVHWKKFLGLSNG